MHHAIKSFFSGGIAPLNLKHKKPMNDVVTVVFDLHCLRILRCLKQLILEAIGRN